MNAPLKAIAAPGNLAAAMRAIGRDARAAAHVLALAPAAQKNRALAAMAKAVRRARPRSSPPTPRTWRRRSPRGATAAFLDRLDARRQARRGDGGRTRGRPQAQGSGRHGHGVLAAAERHAHRARARAARRRRRDLREPAQRHRRCRRALPQGRQCRDPARRLGKLPLRARHPCRAGRGPRRSRPAGGRDLRWCRRATALRSA